MKTIIRGRAFVFGDDVNTDEIIPGIRMRDISDLTELSKYCFEPIRPNFWKEAKAGDIVVAGKNFGCGSSREKAPIVIKETGIRAILAESFARIFYRNAFNIGLIAIECPEAERIEQGDSLEVLANEGVIRNLTKDEEYEFTPIPEFMQQLVDAGGLMEYRAKQMGYRRKEHPKQ